MKRSKPARVVVDEVGQRDQRTGGGLAVSVSLGQCTSHAHDVEGVQRLFPAIAEPGHLLRGFRVFTIGGVGYGRGAQQNGRAIVAKMRVGPGAFGFVELDGGVHPIDQIGAAVGT